MLDGETATGIASDHRDLRVGEETAVDLGLDGRAYVVTGGTSGLGFAAAEALVAEGARVLVASTNPDKVRAARDELGDAAAGAVVDLTDDDAPARLVAACREAHGRLDGLFVSHGGPPPGPAATLDDDDLDRALDLSQRAPIRVLRDVVDQLDGGGSALVLTSSSTVEPVDGLATSNLTRTGVWGYAKTLANEVGPRGVRVNLLLPGRYATERLAELEQSIAERDGTTAEQVRRDAEDGIPLRRLGEPAELGRVAAFLLSPAASYVHGSAVTVDGGAVRGL